MRIISFIYSL